MEKAADIKLESKGTLTFDTTDPMANYTVGTEGYTLDLRNATQESTPLDKLDSWFLCLKMLRSTQKRYTARHLPNS